MNPRPNPQYKYFLQTVEMLSFVQFCKITSINLYITFFAQMLGPQTQLFLYLAGKSLGYEPPLTLLTRRHFFFSYSQDDAKSRDTGSHLPTTLQLFYTL